MKTVINVSNVTDNSGEPPTVTYSNPVTTVINDPAPVRIITRQYYCQICNCNCGCGCQSCCRRCCQNCCNG